MRDSISRQDAIDAVSYSIELCNKALDSMTLGGKDRYAVEVERNSLLKLKDDFKLLPSAEPEPSTDIDNALALLDAIYSSGRMDYYSDYCALHDAISSISAQPEIIRCKDCRWKYGAECVRFAEIRPFPDDFCSRAERRTDE